MKTTEIFKTWLNMNEGTGLNLFDYFEGALEYSSESPRLSA